MKDITTKFEKIASNISTDFVKNTKLNFELRDEDIFRALQKGFWHTKLFARRGSINFGFKIDPSQHYDNWNITKLLDYNREITVAPTFRKFLFLFFFDNLKYERVFQLTCDKIDVITEGLDILKGFDTCILKPVSLRNFLNQRNFKDFANAEDIYKEMLIFAFNEKAVKYLSIIERLSNNLEFFPTLEDLRTLEIFETRVNHIVAQKVARHLINGKDVPDPYPILWKSFQDIHSIDAETPNFRFLPDAITKMEYTVQIISHFLAFEKVNPNPLLQPLYAAAFNLRTNEHVGKYTGLQHLEAAALYDLEFERPILAWNCLVNAAYWSGVNRKETYMSAWDAAIFLAEKNEWDEVHSTLVYQKDFYLKFKRKNNIP